MGVTIKDVAEAAGVSISTVSKVLNGHYSISEKTAERVRGIMREMNYYPNANAQSFASGSNHTVVLLANLAPNAVPFLLLCMTQGSKPLMNWMFQRKTRQSFCAAVSLFFRQRKKIPWKSSPGLLVMMQ